MWRYYNYPNNKLLKNVKWKVHIQKEYSFKFRDLQHNFYLVRLALVLLGSK
jgi:hypothetical protein